MPLGCVPQQENEFIAAEATNHVGGAGMTVERGCNGLQDCVAGQMPVALEIVEVDEDEPGRRSVTLHMRKRPIELSLEAAAVEDIEQRIGFDLLLQMTDPVARGLELGIELLEPIQDQRHGNVLHRRACDLDLRVMVDATDCRSAKTMGRCLPSLAVGLGLCSISTRRHNRRYAASCDCGRAMVSVAASCSRSSG